MEECYTEFSKKKTRSNKKDSNEKPSSIENMSAKEFSEILEEIKGGDRDYSDEKVRNKWAPGKCKRLIKNGATPEILFAKTRRITNRAKRTL